MKLVQLKYRDERKLIVAESLIKRGFDFESSNSFLTDADQEKYNEYEEMIQSQEDDNKDIFYDFLRDRNINCSFLTDAYFSIGQIKHIILEYKYFWDDENNEFMKSEDILKYEECNYLEWFNKSFECEQVEIIDDIIDLELIASNIDDNKALHGQYDVYKDKNDNLYLHFKSYYQGDLGSVEEVTKNELSERFDFEF